MNDPKHISANEKVDLATITVRSVVRERIDKYLSVARWIGIGSVAALLAFIAASWVSINNVADRRAKTEMDRFLKENEVAVQGVKEMHDRLKEGIDQDLVKVTKQVESRAAELRSIEQDLASSRARVSSVASSVDSLREDLRTLNAADLSRIATLIRAIEGAPEDVQQILASQVNLKETQNRFSVSLSNLDTRLGTLATDLNNMRLVDPHAVIEYDVNNINNTTSIEFYIGEDRRLFYADYINDRYGRADKGKTGAAVVPPLRTLGPGKTYPVYLGFRADGGHIIDFMLHQRGGSTQAFRLHSATSVDYKKNENGTYTSERPIFSITVPADAKSD